MDFPEELVIHQLYLQNNSLVSLLPSSFRRPINVIEVDISQNPFRNTLEEAFFSSVVRNVESVTAREIGLNLQNVTALAFLKDARKLRTLDLTRNSAYGVDMLPALFIENNIHSLENLILSFCRIRRINAHAFIGLVHLKTLDLSQNFIKKVPKALNRLSLLRKLNLSENDITALRHGDFSELPCLQELDLSKNLLGQLDAFRQGAFFGLENSLSYLYLHDVHMTNFPTILLSDLKKLIYLDVSKNKITLMNNNTFLGKYKLLTLEISDNPLIASKDMFYGIGESLRTIKIRRAGLNYVPSQALQTLKVLEELDLSFNSILTIDEHVLQGISARRLLFRGNRIHFVSPKAFSHYRRPVDLDISRNELSTLDFIFEAEKCTFYKVNVAGNGFLCDCNIERLINSVHVHVMQGDCVLPNGVTTTLSNTTMTKALEDNCGISELDYCMWWIKNDARKHNVVLIHIAFSFVFVLVIV